ncbi:Oidioi.mRNA.OKI2018_I69.chr1.g74.t1.cds [Oikopleura dioica]|uniref:Oidioi.mRNA.OKI2018_I69.chr1.g74.t1.cds n=1 Tax=Oikopleura dioica TaxID=34765 RepID=A0ABN7SIQ7_OIKDI|nr:Oidioi.mRNA.OKI2018_I69.chr1.g74.t1.cds [Oikopleura dioica]
MAELLKDPEHVKSQEYFGLDRNWALVGIDDVPDWMISSRYLLGSMRPPLESFKLCYSSWFRLHTETGNIWSHFLGFIGFIVLFFVAIFNPLSISILENILICLSVASATLCFAFSFHFHTVRCHSPKIAKHSEKLDYTGILFYALFGFLPIIFFSFRCDSTTQSAYMITLCVVSVGILTMSRFKAFGRTEYRPCRAVAFMSLGLLTIFPTFHAYFKHGIDVAFNEEAFSLLCIFFSSGTTGVLIYATEVPERFFPGKFDIFFHSHQIFHIFAVGAGAVHFLAIRELQSFHSDPCPVGGWASENFTLTNSLP